MVRRFSLFPPQKKKTPPRRFVLSLRRPCILLTGSVAACTLLTRSPPSKLQNAVQAVWKGTNEWRLLLACRLFFCFVFYGDDDARLRARVFCVVCAAETSILSSPTALSQVLASFEGIVRLESTDEPPRKEARTRIRCCGEGKQRPPTTHCDSVKEMWS